MYNAAARESLAATESDNDYAPLSTAVGSSAIWKPAFAFIVLTVDVNHNASGSLAALFTAYSCVVPPAYPA